MRGVQSVEMGTVYIFTSEGTTTGWERNKGG